MTAQPSMQVGAGMPELTDRVDRVLTEFLDGCAVEMEAAAQGGGALVDEIQRLLRAGGKRVRPAFCYWGFRAAGGGDAGGDDEPIVRAAAAMELLHTMALVHDDVLDGATERRGAPTTAPWMALRAPALAPGGRRRRSASPPRSWPATSPRSLRTASCWRAGSTLLR